MGGDNGCGTDVGVFTAELSVAGSGGTGEIKGCLNDQTENTSSHYQVTVNRPLASPRHAQRISFMYVQDRRFGWPLEGHRIGQLK